MRSSPARHDGLQLRLLGELEVVSSAGPLALPQSRKTRALLGYLALSSRPHRRERLCALLWDVADDPRAALRWSLSKLRELVEANHSGGRGSRSASSAAPDLREFNHSGGRGSGSASSAAPDLREFNHSGGRGSGSASSAAPDLRIRPRLIADREHVALDLSQVQVDVHELQRLLAGELEQLPAEQLEAARALFRGELLEGLELPDFHAYQAWLLSERRTYRELQRRVLATLLQRSGRQADRALPLLRELVHLDPTDERARAQLLELLHATGKDREAEEQSRAEQRLQLMEAPASAQDTRAPAAREPDAGPDPGTRVEPAAARPQELPFVGRSAELQQLRGWRAASATQLRMLLVLGDAGLGKTRLLSELAREAAATGARVLRVAAHDAQPGWPYAVFRELLPLLSAEQGQPLFDDSQTPAQELEGRERLFRAIAAQLERAAHASPGLCLLLDDAHWLDDASAELIEFLAGALRGVRLDVLLGAREGELRDRPALVRVLRALRRRELLEELRLSPLTRDETALLVQTLPGAAADSLYAHSAGNPLFAIELAREPLAPGRPPAPSISRLVRDRLDALSPEECDVLRWAAVLGEQFETGLLERLVGLAPELLIDALERLERHGWLSFAADSGRFVHEVVRRAVYDGLSGPRRRLMHVKVARALAADGGVDGAQAAAIAQHAVLGGDRAMGAQACLSTGQRCLRLYAHADAYSLARRGLGYARELPDPERTRLSLPLLELSVYARRPQALDEILPELVALTTRALDLGLSELAHQGFYLRAFLLWERGALGDAQRFSREVERISRTGDVRERVLALGDAARCLAMLERDLPEAEAYLLEAEAAAPALDAPPLVLSLTRGILALHRGEHARAESELERAQQAAEREGRRLQQFCALEYRIQLELARGCHAEALGFATQLAELSERLRGGSEAPYARALLALARYAANPGAETDSHARALDVALQALALEDAKQRQAVVLAHAAELERGRGAWPLAVRHAEAALQLAAAMERHSEVAIAHSVLAAAESAADGRPAAERAAALRAVLEQPISEYARGLVQRAADKERGNGTRHRRAGAR